MYQTKHQVRVGGGGGGGEHTKGTVAASQRKFAERGLGREAEKQR